jgi:hypothetical protein
LGRSDYSSQGYGDGAVRVVFGQECCSRWSWNKKAGGWSKWWNVAEADYPRAELIALRARQLERRPGDILRAAKAQRKSREANCEYFGKNLRRRPDNENYTIGLGDLVLLQDTKLNSSHSHKLSDRWSGPYKVTDASRKEDRGTYKLAELDGTELEGIFSGDRVKKFVTRERF